MDEGAPLHFETVPVATPPGAPVAVELVPAPEPWAVVQKLAHLPHLLFLDSSEQHAERGRYSYVMAGDTDPLIRSIHALEDPFWDDRFECARLTRPAELPPFIGGWAGLFGYGVGRAFERIKKQRTDEFAVPDLALGFYDWVISFDHLTGTRLARLDRDGFRGPIPRRTATTRRIRSQYRAGFAPLTSGSSHPRSPASSVLPVSSLCPQFPLPGFPGVTSNFDRAGYEAAVRRVVEYIHAGDCFQVNLSQRLLAPLREHPLELYGRLAATQPGPVRRLTSTSATSRS